MLCQLLRFGRQPRLRSSCARMSAPGLPDQFTLVRQSLCECC
jgi:hypothetical protein